MSTPERPELGPGEADEPVEHVVEDIKRIFGMRDFSDRMKQRMQRDLARLRNPVDDEPDTCAGGSSGDHGAACDLARCVGREVQDSRAARDVARVAAAKIIADARRDAQEIVAAARTVADEYTNAAILRASKALEGARRAVAYAEGRATGQGPAAGLSGATSAGSPGVPGNPDTPVEERWQAALSAVGVFFAASNSAIRQALGSYARSLQEVAHTSEGTETARRVGAELVALGVNQPAALGMTQRVLAGYLAGGNAAVSWSVWRTLSALADGFAIALRDDILRKQEALHRATVIAGMQDRLSLRVSEAQFRGAAWYDPLTGLANRVLLIERLQQSATRPGDPDRRIGLCLIDLAGFKSINDQHGTDTGDCVLSAVARRLRSLSHRDDLLARAGSDEFTIVVEDSAGVAHMVELAEQIIAAMGEPIDVARASVRVSARVGIVVVPAGSADGNAMLFDAATAIGCAKAEDRSWAVHDPGDGDRTASTSGQARSRDLHPVPVKFQPLINLSDHNVAGFQAFAYWKHPHLREVDLRRIGNLTGNSAAVKDLAGKLLRDVCGYALRYTSDSDGPYVSIELPMHQMGFPDSVDLVSSTLDLTGLPPQRLQIQLRAFDVVCGGAYSHTIIEGLDARGVRIAIDDLGGGFPNPAYLRTLPIDVLRTPIREITGTGAPCSPDDNRRLLDAVAQTAHSIDLALTVYGADDPAHAAVLSGSKCDSVQGDHYAAPAEDLVWTGRPRCDCANPA